jgi:hypothetical protein
LGLICPFLGSTRTKICNAEMVGALLPWTESRSGAAG